MLIFSSKSGLETISDNMTQKPLFYVTFAKRLLEIATPKVPADQKLFERVCYTFILKVTKFQLPTPNSF